MALEMFLVLYLRGGLLVLGRTVTVSVTNPIGSESNGKIFPLNYGSVKGLKLKNGEVQNAYVFGMHNPVYRFTGTVVAIATMEDMSTVWIVAPHRTAVFEPEIKRSLKDVSRQVVKMECHYEKSCGAVLFTELDGVRKYLLVRNRSGFYGFPKGHIEGEETEHETANREILEETGLKKVAYYDHFCEVNRYMCRAHTKKRVVLFLAKFDPKSEIRPTMEIDDCKLLPFEEAYTLIGHQNDKEILKNAEEFLKKH